MSRVSPHAHGHRRPSPACPPPEHASLRSERGAQSVRESGSESGRGSGRDDSAVEALLADLGSQVRRGDDVPPLSSIQTASIQTASIQTAGLHRTGLEELDELLGGGLPCGGLSEIAGPFSSGRGLLALSILAASTARGELVAWVDLADAFDPGSAERSGAALERILWARAPEPRDALRCVERLLETEGFPLVFLDLCAFSASVPSSTTWLRLGRLARATRTALVVLSTDRLAGTRADVALELQAALPRFGGSPPLLEAFELRLELARHRTAPLRSIALHGVIGPEDSIVLTESTDPAMQRADVAAASPPGEPKARMRSAHSRSSAHRVRRAANETGT